MTPSPSQNAETQARTRASLRALRSIRASGAVIAFAAMTVLGIVGLATGHDRGGITAVVIGGIAMIGLIATLARRRRRSGGDHPHNADETTSIATRGPGQER
jgi:LPXTG-motif cell wall-anchored protein